METITVGEIIKAQGIKGELKIKPLTDSPERFFSLKAVYIGNAAYKVSHVRVDGFVYLKLAGIDTRNDAEAQVGKRIEIDRVLAAPLEDGYTFYIADVEGSALIDEHGERLGTITEVSQFGAADVFTVETVDGRVMRFPYLKKLLLAADTQNKTFAVYKDELARVTVYED